MNESNSQWGGTTGVSVGVGEALASAMASFKNQLGTHLVFSLLWVLGLLLSSCLLSCCVMVPFAGVMGAIEAGGSGSGGAEGMVGAMAVTYLVMIAFMLAAMSFHQGVTISIAVDDLRGRSLAVGDAMAAGFRRVVPQSLFALLRMIVDLVIVFLLAGIPVGILIAQRGGGALTGDGAADADSAALVPYVAMIGVGYLVALACVFASRSFYGLGPAAIAVESAGPVASFSRSSELLAGNRVSYVLAKLVVAGIGITLYFGLILTVVGIGALGSTGGSGSAPPDPTMSLVMLPLMLFLYACMLVLYTFDHVVEASFYAKLAKAPGASTEMADVFR